MPKVKSRRSIAAPRPATIPATTQTQRDTPRPCHASLAIRRKGPQDAGDLSQVESLLDKAIHLDPRFGAAYLQLGTLYAERQDYSKAIAAYQQAIHATPEMEEAHYHLAQVYRQTGEADQAKAELRLYDQLSRKSAQKIEQERHEIRQFVYTLRDQPTPPRPQ